MDELGVRGQVQELHRLRQQQQRWRREQDGVGERHHGADRARITRWMVVIGARPLLAGLAYGVGRGNMDGRGRFRLRRASVNGGRGLRCERMKMPERQHKLHRQRKQREPRASFDLRSEPLHISKRLHRASGNSIRPLAVLHYNISGIVAGCQWPWLASWIAPRRIRNTVSSAQQCRTRSRSCFIASVARKISNQIARDSAQLWRSG